MERTEVNVIIKKRIRSSNEVKKRKIYVDKSNKLQVPYIASFRGPILLSAPHSTRVQRGGKKTDTKERLHLREQWVSTLALKIAIEIERI